jgi:hypothetical protein
MKKKECSDTRDLRRAQPWIINWHSSYIWDDSDMSPNGAVLLAEASWLPEEWTIADLMRTYPLAMTPDLARSHFGVDLGPPVEYDISALLSSVDANCRLHRDVINLRITSRRLELQHLKVDLTLFSYQTLRSAARARAAAATIKRRPKRDISSITTKKRKLSLPISKPKVKHQQRPTYRPGVYNDTTINGRPTKQAANQDFVYQLTLLREEQKSSNSWSYGAQRGEIVYLDADCAQTTRHLATMLCMWQRSEGRGTSAPHAGYSLVVVNHTPITQQQIVANPHVNNQLVYLGLLRHYLEYIAVPGRLLALWADYCGTFVGSSGKGIEPRCDIEVLFRRRLLQPQGSILALTFSLRHKTVKVTKEEIRLFVESIARDNGYDISLQCERSYHPSMYFLIYRLHSRTLC